MKPHRVSVAILGLVLLFLAALVGLRVSTLQEDRTRAFLRAEDGMRNLVRVTEQYAQRVFETSALVSRQIGARVAELGGAEALRDSVAVHHWLRDVSESIAGDYLLIVNAAGRPMVGSGVHPVPDVDLSDRSWFRAHLDGAEEHVGQAIYSRITNEVLFTYSQALRRPDGSFDGAVQVSVRTGFFQQPALAAEFGSGVVTGLFDAEGRVLARTGLTPGQVGLSLRGTPVFAATASGQAEGTLRATTPFDGAERIMAFRRLENWPAVVTASVPVAEVLAPWRQAVRWSAEVIGSVALGMLLLAGLAIRIASREVRARAELAQANRALREVAAELEARVIARTRELSESETRFRGIFDSAFQFIGLLAPDGTLLEANRTALQFGGLRREDVVGRPFWEVPWWSTGEETQARLRDAIAAAAAGEPQRYEVMVRGSGDRLATIDFSLKPIRDEAGTVVLLVPEGHDLTELKAAEARLREAQKVEALGQLTGGVAHDFNNLLMVVLGNIGLLRKHLPPDPRVRKLLDGAQQGAERGAALTQRMLAFARRQELRPAPVDLSGLVRGMVPLLERSAGPTVRIAAELPEDLPPALVDANQLELALLNLVVNARDAMPDGGAVEISLDRTVAPAEDAPPGLAPGSYLRLALHDTGTGMDGATLARATEPFFTTKGVGRGSGLGLSMVQGLAQQSGGGLRLTSAPGAGTRAEIWLPRADAAVAPRPAAPPPVAETRPPPRRVLVVDDDPLVAAGTAMMLEDLGHVAIVAASAQEALVRLARDGAVDLVLTDHAMPGMTGTELAETLRRERPDLPIALATGYAEAPGGPLPWLPRLGKPYRQQELDELVRRLTRAAAA